MKLSKTIELQLPEKIEAYFGDDALIIKGPAGEVKRVIKLPLIGIEVKDKKILLHMKKKKMTKKDKMIINTFKAHIKNMIKGAEELHTFKIKICSGHFPITASVEKNQFVIKNFLGETVPRVLKTKPGVDIKVEGDIIIVKSTDKELAGQTAASIEKLAVIREHDRRIFQDGCYIIEKSGEKR